MQVKFLDLSVPTNQIKEKYLEAVERILDKANFILTEEVEDFEKEWAKVTRTKYCAGVSCGADALYVSLAALGVGRGDEVITQGNAYNASVTAILRAGATPRFVDVTENDLRMDVSKIEPLINEKTKAILPVHLYGQANNMEAICALAKKHNLKVVEDCAQAHLAEYDGRPVGSWGDVGAFSFYPTKNLGAFGDAGAVVTDSQEIYEKILAMRNLGQTAKNDHRYLGFNMRLDPVQAVCLKLKLDYLEENTKKRRAAAENYDRLIREADIPVLPVSRDRRATHVYHLYVIQLMSFVRSEFQKKMLEASVQTAVHYPVPVYNQPFYQGPHDPCLITDKVCGQVVSLPLFESIKPEEQEYVIEVMKKILVS